MKPELLPALPWLWPIGSWSKVIQDRVETLERFILSGMAHSHPELNLDMDGNLLDLHNKRTNTLLSAEQVAQCVKVHHLKGGDADGEPFVTFERYRGTMAGKNVTVLGGATGTGKTSLIKILAGGMQTEPKLQSDTKCPTIYIIEVDGCEVAILDTAGLCDTDAEANKVPEMQDLLVNAVAATIKRFQLIVVNFLMCVDVGGRLPGKFCEVWPQMQISLGGERLGSFCHFVMTKANADSKVAKAQLKKLPESEAYKQLKYSSLGWPLMTGGYENLDEIKSILKVASEAQDGLGAEDVRADVEGLEVKRKKADEVQKLIFDFEKKMQEEKLKTEKMLNMVEEVEEQLNDAYEELGSLGSCSDGKKEELRGKMKVFKDRKTELKKQHREGLVTEEQLRASVGKWQKDLAKEIEEIRTMEQLGNPFLHLSRAAGKVMDVVLGKSSHGGS